MRFMPRDGSVRFTQFSGNYFYAFYEISSNNLNWLTVPQELNAFFYRVTDFAF